MTKEKYMALADLQTVWDDSIKPWINGQKADKADVDALAAAIGYDTDAEFVDLGLPSGTLWAKCNVGATVETGYGNYYMYGKGSSQYNSSDSAYSGTENPLDPTKDTAAVVMGSPWHMPTKAQFDELIANTNYSFTTINGVAGGKFTSKTDNTKYVFFPAAGFMSNIGRSLEGSYAFCWSSTPKNSDVSYQLMCGSNKSVSNDNRIYGYSVRGVASRFDLLTNVKAALALKADKSELPTYATPAECRAIVTGYVPETEGEE